MSHPAHLAPLLLERSLFDRAAIRERIPQRHEMELLERIVELDVEAGLVVGVVEVRSDGFWVRGHFPSRPVLPGVLMLEAAGQLCSFYHREAGGNDNREDVLAFAAADGVKFRRAVEPGESLVIVARVRGMTPRRLRFRTEGFVGERLAFEAELTGVVLR